jgi:hypothetical protein
MEPRLERDAPAGMASGLIVAVTVRHMATIVKTVVLESIVRG